MIVIKDANGQYIPVEEEELMSVITQGTLLGMNIDCIAELRSTYLERGGKEPITIKSIREAFDFNAKQEKK